MKELVNLNKHRNYFDHLEDNFICLKNLKPLA